jgi:hypothetical protein
VGSKTTPPTPQPGTPNKSTPKLATTNSATTLPTPTTGVPRVTGSATTKSAPKYACTYLGYLTIGQADVNGNQKYQFTAQASAGTGVKIGSYVFDFNDNSAAGVITTSASQVSTDHTYAPGNHTANVTVNFTSNNVGYSSTCSTKLTTAFAQKPAQAKAKI